LLEDLFESFPFELGVKARKDERYGTRLAELMKLFFQLLYVVSVEPVECRKRLCLIKVAHLCNLPPRAINDSTPAYDSLTFFSGIGRGCIGGKQAMALLNIRALFICVV
jgi:hypothetical protein